jgi:hypothetical protein
VPIRRSLFELTRKGRTGLIAQRTSNQGQTDPCAPACPFKHAAPGGGKRYDFPCGLRLAYNFWERHCGWTRRIRGLPCGCRIRASCSQSPAELVERLGGFLVNGDTHTLQRNAIFNRSTWVKKLFFFLFVKFKWDYERVSFKIARKMIGLWVIYFHFAFRQDVDSCNFA